MALRSLLSHQPVVILDGATGSELERRCIKIDDSKLWSAKLLTQDPSVLRDIHADYYRAGADCCTTATYQASVQGFLDDGVSPADTSMLFVRAVELCDAAREGFWAQHCDSSGAGAPMGALAGAQGSDEGQRGLGCQSRRQRPLVAYSCGAYGAYLADGSEFSSESQGMGMHAHVASKCPPCCFACAARIRVVGSGSRVAAVAAGVKAHIVF